MEINVDKQYFRVIPGDLQSLEQAIRKIYRQVNKVIDASLEHNDLSGLQGGAAGEYYHLTETQHTKNIIGDYVSEYGALELVR